MVVVVVVVAAAAVVVVVAGVVVRVVVGVVVRVIVRVVVHVVVRAVVPGVVRGVVVGGGGGGGAMTHTPVAYTAWSLKLQLPMKPLLQAAVSCEGRRVRRAWLAEQVRWTWPARYTVCLEGTNQFQLLDMAFWREAGEKLEQLGL